MFMHERLTTPMMEIKLRIPIADGQLLHTYSITRIYRPETWYMMPSLSELPAKSRTATEIVKGDFDVNGMGKTGSGKFLHHIKFEGAN